MAPTQCEETIVRARRKRGLLLDRRADGRRRERRRGLGALGTLRADLERLLARSYARAHDCPALAESDPDTDRLAGAVHGDADGRTHNYAADPRRRFSKLWLRWCRLHRRRRRCHRSRFRNTPRLFWLRLEKETVCSRRSNRRGAGARARARTRSGACARAGLRHSPR